MSSPIILVRVPFRISLGGGSTDLPSYYRRHGGFIFGVSINLYMDLLVKEPRSDDLIHVHYKQFEAVDDPALVRHDLARTALNFTGIKRRVAISFKADTPAGTGLGSSGACAVALMRGLSFFRGRDMSNEKAAAAAFRMTQDLSLPDGPQDPYLCALGGFKVLRISPRGRIDVEEPKISPKTVRDFFNRTLFFYTGIQRDSTPILRAQQGQQALGLKHQTKEIGLAVLDAFVRGELDEFGCLLDRHWQLKKQINGQISTSKLDRVYEEARAAGALGGKIMGAGGGGYFMFFCPTDSAKKSVRLAMKDRNMREMDFKLDKRGGRVKVVDF